MEQLNAKRLYKERVECHEIHGTMPEESGLLLISAKRDQL